MTRFLKLIAKWYGAGLAWFLLRLVLSIILGIVDTFLTICSLLGQAGFVMFGPTGRNFFYGFLALIIIGAGMLALSG